MKISELISSIRGMNKFVNSESIISDRFIYNEASSIKNMLVKQEENKQRLFSVDAVFKTILNVSLTDVDTIEACGIDSDCFIRRSKDKLPKIIEGTGGPLIKAVTSLDGLTRVTIISEDSYARKLVINDKHAKNEPWAFIRNDYLYLPNVSWAAAKVSAIFENPEEVDALNDCGDGVNPDCLPMGEREFPIPNYLEDTLKELLNNRLLNYYHRIVEDTNLNKNSTK